MEAVDGVDAFDLRLYTIFSYGVRLFSIHFLHTLHLFYLPPPKKEEKEWNTVAPINDFDHWLPGFERWRDGLRRPAPGRAPSDAQRGGKNTKILLFLQKFVDFYSTKAIIEA